MKYCSHCGKQLEDEALICPGCGCATEAYAQSFATTQTAAPAQSGGQLSALSIVGFVFAFLSPLIGLICSIVAYKAAVTECNEKTKSFSKAGTIISAVFLAIEVLVFVIVIIAIIGFGAYNASTVYPYEILY